MTVRRVPLQTTIVQLDGQGPFELPHLRAALYLKYPGEGLSVRMCLIVEPGKELQIPLEPDYGRQI